ncbi:hypothetical protein HNP46_005755 [Pseudomonas nitritireducens]|uniref:Uncharacterized protein n=1 Tax=Pseudomonas nitroreducens TaxID=46680 RepID=A0A7W7KQX3_PSENT|nr:hypothetical protein [Pseudomonas nitritireducens]MBB4866848.1 hypothetical protein [Pseudomonas nitritireducens]
MSKDMLERGLGGIAALFVAVALYFLFGLHYVDFIVYSENPRISADVRKLIKPGELDGHYRFAVGDFNVSGQIFESEWGMDVWGGEVQPFLPLSRGNGSPNYKDYVVRTGFLSDEIVVLTNRDVYNSPYSSTVAAQMVGNIREAIALAASWKVTPEAKP